MLWSKLYFCDFNWFFMIRGTKIRNIYCFAPKTWKRHIWKKNTKLYRIYVVVDEKKIRPNFDYYSFCYSIWKLFYLEPVVSPLTRQGVSKWIKYKNFQKFWMFIQLFIPFFTSSLRCKCYDCHKVFMERIMVAITYFFCKLQKTYTEAKVLDILEQFFFKRKCVFFIWGEQIITATSVLARVNSGLMQYFQ